MFIVDLGTPGIRVVRTPAYTHTYGHHHPVVAFEDVRVPRENLVGSEGDGMQFAYEWFRYERLMIAARAVGAMERLIEEATAAGTIDVTLVALWDRDIGLSGGTQDFIEMARRRGIAVSVLDAKTLLA